jgi:hypothetical protein
MATKKKPTSKPPKPAKVSPPPTANTKPINVQGPLFGQPAPTPDPAKFLTPHASDL